MFMVVIVIMNFTILLLCLFVPIAIIGRQFQVLICLNELWRTCSIRCRTFFPLTRGGGIFTILTPLQLPIIRRMLIIHYILIFLFSPIAAEMVVVLMAPLVFKEDLPQYMHQSDVVESANGDQEGEAHPPVEAFAGVWVVDRGLV